MDDLKVGEYVRTNDGIFKVTKIDGLYIYLDKEYFDNQYQTMRDVTFKERIVNHSFNIIDLIEVGDFVNENEVIDKYLFNGEIPVLETTGDETNAKCMCEGDIKTILTHEQYAKKELYSYLHSKKLEERKLEQIEEQKAKLTKITSILSDMPKGTPDNHKLDTNIVQLMELISEHIKIMEDEEKNLIKITNKINMVDQPYKNILELRFIEGKKVYEVSVAIDRSYRYTKTLIKKAIKKYAEI